MKNNNFKIRPIFKISILVLFFLVLLPAVMAEDYSSSSFVLRDPVVTISGGRSVSASFEYYSNTGQTAAGEATSASFIGRSGFLYYPQATSPVLSATAGNGQVVLNWTASLADLANITDYQLGVAATAGGTYTYASVGNVTSYTKTGLTNDTTYYFKIKAYAGSLFLANSAEVSAKPTSPVIPACGDGACNGGETCTTCQTDCGKCGGGGGGGGGGTPPPNVGGVVNLSGRAYPLSKISVLKDGQIVVTTIAGPDANFNISVTGLSSGSYNFAVYGEDNQGIRSSMFTFPVLITSGVTVNIGGIFIAPTINVDKSEVKKGDNIIIFGQTSPAADVTIAVNSDQEFFVQTKSDKIGAYLYNYDTAVLAYGQHSTKSKSAIGGEISSYSKTVGFAVSQKSVISEPSKCPLKGDVNDDCRVNLVDFSIAAYWYKRPLSQTFIAIEKSSLSGDGKVDLVDFSIMAYYWTG